MADHPAAQQREEWEAGEALQRQREVQIQKAREAYKVTHQGANMGSVYMSAECGTGSRYAVVISNLPYIGAVNEGGTHLISVIQPWQTSTIFQLMPGEVISEHYIMTKLLPRNRDVSKVHGGDLFGLTETVNRAAQHWHFLTDAAKKNNREHILREDV